MAAFTFVLIALAVLTCLACTALLYRQYTRTRLGLLFWAALCFVFLSFSNVLLFFDVVLFPTDVEALFVDTYETLVRVTEEIDVARDLLGGVRDYYQAKITEQQNDVAKKLTVIASLVLVPSLIVGFYGQNFGEAFQDWYWGIGVSVGLILATTIVQVALFRWRRWI